MKKQIIHLMSLVVLFAMLSACNKDTDTDFLISEDLITAEDLTTSENFIEDTDDEVDLQIENATGGGGTAACPIVTFAEPWGTFPNHITIDYGSGCEGPGGRIRKGIIEVQISSHINEAGAVRILSFVSFSIDDAQLEGVKTLTNNGKDADGLPSFTREVEGLKITFPNGDIASWDASHTLKQIDGLSTNFRMDDVFEITGFGQGINRNGKTYQGKIDEPLVKRKDCRWIVSGVREAVVDGKLRTIDYGNGGCNPLADVTLPNGETKTVRIHRWW